LDSFNKAFVNSWLAHYPDWRGAKVVKGPMKDAVICELLQQATDELRHDDSIAGGIIRSGGMLEAEPKNEHKVVPAC